ncbi:MAG TPA: alpha/beta fold hydrolase, partial [Gemmatimonadaceae bacterium]|nr:alpha/beta fold hydrolase [Gemmatimonadaceae bacterium]
MKALLAIAILAVAACQVDQTGPAHPSIPTRAVTSTEPEGPPEPRSFGPDTYTTGVFTGTGRHKLDCVAAANGGRVCDGFLRSSVDKTYLDARLEIPPGTGPFPLVTLIHGYGGSKRSSGDIASDLVVDGYAVLRYSTRGFGDSWGQVNLADVNAEIGDLRSMIAEVVDEKDFNLDPGKVAVTGASYGGGHSWLALLQPVFETKKGNTVRIVAVAPIVPWTDLLFALLPNGRPRNSIDGLGGLKLSFVNGLYASGIRENAARPYPNYPMYFVAWHAALNATEPNSLDPVWDQIVDGVAGYRSIWWRQDFWTTIAQNRVPIFQVQGFTDDLFPVPEAKRMLLALKSIDPGYPIVSYFGDLGHPRASNRPAEMRYVLDLIRSW